MWVETPLVLSDHLSSLLDCNAYLKLESLQTSQSFKYRGISLFAQHCKDIHGNTAHLIIASGGNAGLAAACAANRLALKCTVYLPEGTNPSVISRLQQEKAEVVVVGKYYLEAAQEAEKAVKSHKNSYYVHGYEGTLLWQGHGSMIKEIAVQQHSKPDAIVCSVGGGGLLGGVIYGCRERNWDDVPIIAMETHGAATFYHSMSLNHQHWRGEPSLPNGATETFDEKHGLKLANVLITSKASSLAATSPSAAVMNDALQRKGKVICVTIPDQMAMRASYLFAEDHKILTELACSTTIALGYHPDIVRKIQETHIEERASRLRDWQNVVFIVCGGVKISIDEVLDYRAAVRDAVREHGRYWDVFCNGERWDIPMGELDAQSSPVS